MKRDSIERHAFEEDCDTPFPSIGDGHCEALTQMWAQLSHICLSVWIFFFLFNQQMMLKWIALKELISCTANKDNTRGGQTLNNF